MGNNRKRTRGRNIQTIILADGSNKQIKHVRQIKDFSTNTQSSVEEKAAFIESIYNEMEAG